MNEQLVKILEKAYEAAIKTGEFIVEEGGILMEQFLVWKVWEHSLIIVIGLLLAIIFPIICRSLINENNTGYSDTINFFGKRVSEFNGVLLYFMSGILIITGALLFFINLFSLIQLIVAPNVYLMEYILNRI